MALIDNPISSIVTLVGDVLDRVLPNKEANDAAKAQVAQMLVKGELDQVMGQIQTNIEEAKSNSTFVAGWRPAVGWACGAAFAYAFILQPFIILGLVVFHAKFDPSLLPKLDLASMMPVLLGMLGLGAMRSFDKTQGTDNGH